MKSNVRGGECRLQGPGLAFRLRFRSLDFRYRNGFLVKEMIRRVVSGLCSLGLLSGSRTFACSEDFGFVRIVTVLE